jgi:ABC transporter DrrB family efflux protein
MSSLRFAVSDALVLAQRSLKRIPRQPDLLTAFTIQPVMFMLLFVYVFGGAIEVGPQYNGDYTDFLIPGIMVQTIAFGGFVTAIGLSEDLNKGLIDRFRSLPMARSAVLAGRTLADVVVNLFGVIIVIAVGYVVGFRFSTSVPEVLYGVFLLLIFGYAFSWIFALVGLYSTSAETAQQIGFTAIFPLTFISSAFVPIENLPAPLEAFAEVNPFTITVDAMRHLFVGTPAGNSVWGATLWSIGLTIVFAPLAVAKYRRVSSR